eukprot:evm.model.scf_168.9 EVM.evm.TU.scf_168.9   scf_168:64105-67522(+)
MAELRTWFDAIDTDRNGHLTSEELQQALALGNLHFSLAAVAHMIRTHDMTGSGTITFPEFQRLHQFLSNMQSSFIFFDVDRNGQLTFDEVARALKHSGFNIERHAFDTMVKAFDPNRTASLDLAAYIALSLFLKSAAATFAAFDPNKTGRITLDFNQFLYAAANVI